MVFFEKKNDRNFRNTQEFQLKKMDRSKLTAMKNEVTDAYSYVVSSNEI